jgi:hypothetical protein
VSAGYGALHGAFSQNAVFRRLHCTEIVDLNASVKTSYLTTSDALKTEEFSLLEPGILDNKYYVRGIGLVAERTVRGGDRLPRSRHRQARLSA